MTTHKVCLGCGIDKPMDEYHNNPKGKYGKASQCKECYRLRNIRKRKKGKPMSTEGYSTDRYCPVCKETKNWRSYVFDMTMCKDCYRAMLAGQVHGGPDRHHSASKKKHTLTDVLEFIQARTGA